MAQTRQSRPDSGLGFQEKDLNIFKFFPLRSEAALQFPGMFSRRDLGIGEHADEFGDDVARADERDRSHVGRHVVHHAHTPRAQL